MTCEKCAAPLQQVAGLAVFALIAGQRLCLPCGGMPKPAQPEPLNLPCEYGDPS